VSQVASLQVLIDIITTLTQLEGINDVFIEPSISGNCMGAPTKKLPRFGLFVCFGLPEISTDEFFLISQVFSQSVSVY
jgi:hypothetical protein